MRTNFFAAASIVLISPALLLAASTPNDAYFPQQWYLHNDGTQAVSIDIDDYHTLSQKGRAGVDIGWLEAQDQVAAQAKSPVTVAVLDYGVDPTHPELAGRIAPDGADVLKDNPANGPVVFDDNGHGTHVSGIIAANANNGAGIAGVAPPSVKILPVRVLSGRFKNFALNGRLISDYAADAINYAVAHGAGVINMSFGWPKLVDTQNARDAVKNAVEHGVLIVASAGNDRKSAPTYPCDYDGVLCVGAISNNGELAFFSNSGGIVDLLAPGDGIVSLFPLKVESTTLRIQGYERMRGTSQAAPIVAGVAATLRSIFPTISLNELRARLLISAGNDLPKADASLYGSVSLKRAIDAQPQPVYMPTFKGMESVKIDEATLRTEGQFAITNLWAEARAVHVEIKANGAAAGSLDADTLRSGSTIAIPWAYRFASLDQSSEIAFTLSVSDSAGTSRSFSFSMPAVRAGDQIAGAKAYALPSANWVGSGLGKLYSNFAQVPDYPLQAKLPAYVQRLGWNDQGTSFQIYDPSSSSPLQTVNVAGITTVGSINPQVIRMDADGDGKPDWVFIGPARDKSNLYYQFYFLNSEFKPLYGTPQASTWRVQVDSRYASVLARNYAAPGSWISSGNHRLVPAFMASAMLPDADNYRPLSEAARKIDTHLFYLNPVAPTASAPQDPTAPVTLEVRAIDGKAFRDQFGGVSSVSLLNSMPLNAAEEAAGHLQILVSMNSGENGSTGLDASVKALNVRSITDFGLQDAVSWDAFSANGQPILVLTADASQMSNATFGAYDTARGNIAWNSPSALVQSEYDFENISNPIHSLIGAEDLGAKGRFWFLESQFDLVGYAQKSPDQDPVQATLPLERDSSFPGMMFSEFFTPTVVGTATQPLAGVFVDSSLVRGNRVSVAAMNPDTGAFFKPLRYSIEIPAGCVQMSPVHLGAAPETFALPMFCQSGNNQTEFRILQGF